MFLVYPEQYLTKFSWHKEKYPTQLPLKKISEIISTVRTPSLILNAEHSETVPQQLLALQTMQIMNLFLLQQFIFSKCRKLMVT